jgi:hypothetical protein
VWARIARYVEENFDDLLALDLKAARLLGAPAPHTLSSWAHQQSPFFYAKIIDALFYKIRGQTEHCRDDFLRIKGDLPSGSNGQ